MVISKVEGCGLHPCAVVSDMGTKKIGMWNEYHILRWPILEVWGKQEDFYICGHPTPIKKSKKPFVRYGASAQIWVWSINYNSMAGAPKRLDSLSKTNQESYSKMPQETQETAKFIQKIIERFDFFNTTRPIMDSSPTKKAVGYPGAFSKTSEILLDVLDTVREMRVPGNNDLLPFQKGIIRNIKGYTSCC